MQDSAKKPEPSKGAKIFAAIFTGVVFVIILSAIFGGGSTDKKADITPVKEQTSEQTKPAAAKEQAPKVPAEYVSALVKAESYATTQYMSKQGVYDQLTSQYGEQFSKPAAQYAIDHVKADWNANALAKAKQYQEQQSMSPAAIHDQLTSQYGEKFTATQADYAIAHLND